MGRKKGNYTINQPDLIEHVTQRANNNQLGNNQQGNNQLGNDTRQDDQDSDKAMLTPEGGGEANVDSGIATDAGSSTSSTNSTNSSTTSSSSSSGTTQQGTRIPHMTVGNAEDLYALPVKRSAQQGKQETQQQQQEEENTQETEKTDNNPEEALPPGWEKHEDNDGPYYWHIKSGTITRTPPPPVHASNNAAATTTTTTTAAITTSNSIANSTPAPVATLRHEKRTKDGEQTGTSANSGSVTRSNTSSALSELSDSRPRTAAVDNAYKRRSYPARSDLTEGGVRPIRFAVRSLGWVEIAEEDLTPERSSKAVNRCIVDLSVGRRDVLDVVGRWGDGKDLFMDLDEGSLKLVDPENLTVLNTQPIHTIRVWGVGRDNGRDFAYVARDRVTRKHMCHVFRCDTPARTIANTLRDICKKIMIERSLQQTGAKPTQEAVSTGSSGGNSGRLTRPTNLPTEHRRLYRHSQIVAPQSFPTPMEEPKKVMRAQLVGSLLVNKPSGMDVLNSAIDTLADSTPQPWKQVSIAIAPSTVTIANADDGKQIAECRVRFLSFLGIGTNVKHCAFIMHTAQDEFIAYVFYCEPSSGALCKTIEAACKLRYQKCLDAHPAGMGGHGRSGANTPRSISAALRSVFTSITGRKARSAES
ncbi:protein Fe65 homolog [Oratosquilla oratoria]|uniref:protein Fe65 homolog n=1 Tax=Oratosquilla oratoria TaxID=337810 RepID=UPI003F7573A6